MRWTRPSPVASPAIRRAWKAGPWLDEPDQTEFRYYDLICIVRRDDGTGCFTAYVEDPAGTQSFRCSTAMYPDEAEPTGWSFVRFDSEDRPLTGMTTALDYVSYDNAIEQAMDMARIVHFRNPARVVRMESLHPVFFTDCRHTDRVTMAVPWPKVRVGARDVPLYRPQVGKDFDDVVQIMADHLRECERLGKDPVWFPDEVKAAKDSLPEILRNLEKP